jgi:uncharacterized protein (TIGR03118 family)
MNSLQRRRRLPAQAALLATLLVAGAAASQTAARADGGHGDGHDGAFVQTNLVSDIPGMATLFDPAVRNPWGIAFGPTTPLWVNNQFSPDGSPSKITLYRGANGVDPISKVPLEVSASSPTGMVFNPTDTFLIDQGAGPTPARFLFTEADFSTGAPSAVITGWSPPVPPATPPLTTTPTAARTTPGFPVGLAMVPAGKHRSARLLMVDGVSGTVQVFDDQFMAVPDSAGMFMDPKAADEGLSPYNVAVLKGKVYVSYDHGPGGPPGGAVSVFKKSGKFKKRLITSHRLDGAWGMAIAPKHWGEFGGRLLVGNVEDGLINAFGRGSGHFKGTLKDASGAPLVNPGLWGIEFGNGTIGTPNSLIFAAGIGDEVGEHVYEHGLVGIIEPTGEDGDD